MNQEIGNGAINIIIGADTFQETVKNLQWELKFDKEIKMIDIRCGDCLELMKTIPDKSIDMILTDPPYGIKADKGGGMYGCQKHRIYKGNWDFKRPSKEYFDEIFRIGKK